MPIGAAISGAIGAVGSIGGGLINASAANSASSKQAQAAANALALQKQMFGTAQTALNPYIQGGQSALSTLLGLETPGSSAATLQSMPGFQFQSQWGNLAATNQLAAQGLGGSAGPLGSALSQFNQGLAGTYYQNAVNSLMGTAGLGAGAASSLAGNAVNFGNIAGNTMQGIGNAQASGILGSANALAGGIGGATGGISNALLFSQLFGSAAGGTAYNNSTGGYMGMTDQQQDALQDSGFNLPG